VVIADDGVKTFAASAVLDLEPTFDLSTPSEPSQRPFQFGRFDLMGYAIP